MMTLRLLADDLTGALDTAAELVPLAGPLPVFWADALPEVLPSSCAIDGGTRERTWAAAIGVTEGLAPALGEASLAYKKVDSLLRGHGLAELAACLHGGTWDACVLAPAFPHQGRVTRDGVQFARSADGGWERVDDVVALLDQAGATARRGDLDAPLGPGVTLFDAETDADLRRIADRGRAAPGRVLWCGSAGLAQALSHGAPTPSRPSLAGPALGLFGSDHDATARQLAACAEAWLRLTESPGAPAALARRLAEDGAVLASLDLPKGLARADAAARIAAAFATVVRSLPQPSTLLVAGGETLRGLCATLGTVSLTVHGQLEPGLPVSTMNGGRWDGTTVVSKSGAFGGASLWRDLLSAHGLLKTSGRAPGKVSA